MRVMHGVVAIMLCCGLGGAQAVAPAQTTPAQTAPTQTAPAQTAPAQAAPADATARCNDGSYSKARQKWQACGGHKGVQTWFAGGGASPAKIAAAAPAGEPAQATASEAGKVWVNMQTKVYRCPGSRFFGKTKSGSYMSEAEAKKAGAHADRGKPCGT